jgi:hypothetical protein
MKQSVEHNKEFPLPNKFCLEKIYSSIFELSGFKDRSSQSTVLKTFKHLRVSIINNHAALNLEKIAF